MERGQFKTLVKGMKAVYSDPKFIEDKDAFDVWYSLLHDLDYDIASQAIQKYMMSNRFPPTIADIREQYNDFTASQELSEMEAWSLVSKAIRNSGYNSVEEFEKLPPLVQKTVGLPSQLRTWALDENYNEGVAMSSFQRAYKVELKRHEELQKMPKNVRQLIEKANVGSYSAQISDKRKQTIESANARKQGEIKTLEIKHEGIPMPDKYKERLEDMDYMACFGANLLQAREIGAYTGYDNEIDKEEKIIVPLCNFYGLHEESFEVIGNVCENADLLKEAGNE